MYQIIDSKSPGATQINEVILDNQRIVREAIVARSGRMTLGEAIRLRGAGVSYSRR